ncbi:hypothetical protein FUSO5_08170, partial [Fusobacterium necrophorum BFTR-1]
ELVQLMEQGDQVVKSPWASWQFGMNYFYNNGTKYKGRGDRSEKYSYEGIFTRSTDVFERNTSLDSVNYSKLTTSSDFRSGTTSLRKGILSQYGLVSERKVKEPIASFDVTASINPRNIEKTIKEPKIPSSVTFDLPKISVTLPTAPNITSNIPVVNVGTVQGKTVVPPVLPKTIAFNLPEINITTPTAPTITPTIPTVAIPTVTPNVAGAPHLPEAIDFNPITPKVVIPEDPALPEPPTFAVVLGADCNTACSQNEQPTKTGFLESSNNKSQQNIPIRVRYTWSNNKGAEKRYAFKMDLEENLNWGSRPNEMFFNSYNFGYKDNSVGEYANPVDPSQGDNRNNQYFFIGGSRFIEFDNMSYGAYEIPSNKTIHLGGILSLGFVVQDNGITAINSGKITDISENKDQWIKEMPTTTGKDYLEIKGPSYDPAKHEETVYKIKRSADGYVGYKIGMAQVEEDGDTGNVFYNRGTLEFYGERSIGMYSYLPTHTSKIKLINEKNITMSGKESYGMRLNSHTDSNAKMVNEVSGTITLRKNPTGVDKADNSGAMALMKDASVKNGVSLVRGKAVNKGTINLENVQNSLGAYVNIDSDITNIGNININSEIAEVASDQPVNIGMRADGHADAKVINNDSGTIKLDGSYAIGMLAKGSKLTNKGTITTGTKVSNGIGIVGIDNAKIENSGSIKVTGEKNNIGIFLKNGSEGTIGTTGGTESIDVKGNESTGVLVTKGGGAVSTLEMAGDVKVSGNAVSGIVADESKITLKNSATVTVNNNGVTAGAIEERGSYGIVVKGATGKFIGEETTVTANVATNKSTGLYSEGQLIVKNANITTSDGATNFYAKDDGEIELKGNDSKSETGKKSLLFYTDGTNAKIKITGKMEATIKGGTGSNDRGTAFLYRGSGYSKFDSAAITKFATKHFEGLNNLTLNMETGSRLFAAQDVAMNLSDTDTTGLATALGVNFEGSSDYKTFMLYDSKLTVDKDVNLDSKEDAYNKLEISSSSIENNSKIEGKVDGKVAIAQKNTNTINRDRVTLTNNGTIGLTGKNSTGIYAKFGVINNNS